MTTILCYEKPTSGATGRFACPTQPLLSNGAVTTAWTSEQKGSEWNLLITILAQSDTHAVETARKVLSSALSEGTRKIFNAHHAWWRDRWLRSQVQIPDPDFERLWLNGIHKLASSSYDSVPVGLQGLALTENYRRGAATTTLT